jgi:hypothetical protein
MELEGLYGELQVWLAAHPNLGAAIGPWVLMGLGAVSLAILHLWPLIVSRLRFEPLEILYEPKDPRFVNREYRSRTMVTRYRIGVHNATTEHSIHDVVVSADKNLFVENTIEEAWGGTTTQRIDRIDPGATEFIEFFGLADNFGTDDPRDVFSAARRFTIRASAKDTRETLAEFEFDRKTVPMIRGIS